MPPGAGLGPSGTIEIEERDQANNLVATYIRSSDGGAEDRSRFDVVVPRGSTSFARSVLNAFLPAGYPHSVTDDYLEYQIYIYESADSGQDSLQAFSSSIAGLLSSRAVLEGIGVGDSHASPTAALLLSVLQDSMGRIATILFAHRLGTSLEPECKMYRLAADIFNDAAMILDCLSPAFPKSSRVLVLSLSSVLRSLCGVAAQSSKASLSAHFATQGNLGELNAKDSSQETVISLLGMVVGSLMVARVSSQAATWTAMMVLLAIHLGMNYLAVRAVSMRTLNRQRTNLVFSTLYRKLPLTCRNKELESVDGFPTPDKISLQERIFETDGVLRWQGAEILGYCQIGVPLRSILNHFSVSGGSTSSYTGTHSQSVAKLMDIFQDDGYIMWYDEPRKRFQICLKFPSDTETQLGAWMHALFMAVQIQSGLKDGSVIDIIASTRREFQSWMEMYKISENLKRVGWDLDTAALETKSGTRIRTKNDELRKCGPDTPWKF